ncbi:hypothetical protein NPJ88_012755 [Halomonas elongata]|uniref:ankyrin repeat domain-containing protein n=1 Tax=Halomonas elongata TaxID=2746 RepID=UPI00255B27A8|nr:ankyrin repeat domain-containing protein [Halomonas elongata]MDL4863208.1 hypothetical protein [Halomonas elongata]
MNSSFSLRKVIGCVVLVLSTLFLADVMAAEPSGGGQQASSEWGEAMQAVRDGEKKLLQNIVQDNKGFVSKVDESFTLLSIAASEGDYEIVRMLVRNGADPDAGNGVALYRALSGFQGLSVKKEIKDRLEISLYLLKNGASFNHMAPGHTAVASIIEDYIMNVCDRNSKPEYSTAFLKNHGFGYPVSPEFRSNYFYIADLTKDAYGKYGKDRACVDFMFRATGAKGVDSYIAQ